MNTIVNKKDWKKELKKIRLDALKASSPGFFEMSGGYDMKIKPYSDNTANGLTNCIIDWINFSGGNANRINTQGQVRKERVQLAFGNYRNNIRYTPSATNKGTADIHAIVRGRHVSIEVKVGKDRLSLNQLKEMVRVTNAGGLYFIARDMQSFVDWFKETFPIKNIKSV